MDRIEFDKLVGDYKNKVYNTCLGFVKNHEDAQDLAQEVFIEVFRKRGSFRGESKVSTWLYRIAVNKSLEYLRKNQRLKRQGNMRMESSFQEKPADKFYHPGLSLENKERGAILFEAIDALPEHQKVAFTLQKVEGLRVDEIVGVMDKSASSIESLLHRAKENLKIKLKKYYEKD